jgi:hypothetical protein
MTCPWHGDETDVEMTPFTIGVSGQLEFAGDAA